VLLVLHDLPDAAGRRRGAEESIWSTGSSHVVAVWFHHHRVLHGQPGSVPHGIPAGGLHRDLGGFEQAVQDTVRAHV